MLTGPTTATSLLPAGVTVPFDSFTGSIKEGGTLIAHVTGWDLKVDSAIQPNFANGSDSAQSVSVGTVKVSGNMTVYYVDQLLRTKFVNGTSSTLELVLGSTVATKAISLKLGTVKYTSNTRDDAELARVESMGFAATFTATDGTLMITETP